MIVPEKILEKYPAPVPRYTSYPTAPHFVEGLGQSLASKSLVGIGREERISVYIHIPFCDRMCWFCGCHTKQTNRYAPVAAYLKSLSAEIALLGERIPFKPKIGQLHLGGGSPSMVSSEDFQALREELDQVFQIDTESEISVEIDPNDLCQDTLAGLKALGMTRASIGVQDFEPKVQAAINRPQTYEETKSVIDQLRSTGIHSLNIDALYGLPLQTVTTVEKTIADVISLSPDRVALFGYAHVPWMKKHQKLIQESDLPDSIQRFYQARAAENALIAAGYQKIGFDHFAKPDDDLAIAARTGSLHRNFQGYTTDNCKTLLGLGASSIGRFDGGYIQNIVATGQYKAAIECGRLPTERGRRFCLDDKIRGFMIERLMCDFKIDTAELKDHFGDESPNYIDELADISRNDEDGLCELEDGVFRVPVEAQPFVRIVAARLDAYLGQGQFRYSKAV